MINPRGITTEGLRAEVRTPPKGSFVRYYYMGIGYSEMLNAPVPVARANAFRSLVTRTPKIINDNDLIAGTIKGLYQEGINDEDISFYEEYCSRFGNRGWLQGCDHYAPTYDRLLSLGVDGIRDEITSSMSAHSDEPKKSAFLEACDISMKAFAEMIELYGKAADEKGMSDISEVCHKISHEAPTSFREALQLVWFAHQCFLYQGLYAMALGRIDQYLYHFYRRDIDSGVMTREEAQLLLENVFMKIGDNRTCYGSDDVCNICIAGITPDGENGTTELTFDVLRAVKNCNIPGPNLSARINPVTPDEFLEEALTVIGTGLGYPALMNDLVHIPALKRMGYTERDCNNYCMVGCIENFLPGMQPPWSDGRFDNVKYLEYTLNRGVDLLTGAKSGIDVGDPREWKTMDEFMDAYKRELRWGASEYANRIYLENGRYNNYFYCNPFMSCLTYKCVERGLDICDGGTIYPSAHGAVCMGIGTITDSLSAIEECVYDSKTISMDTLISALRANYEGYDEMRAKLMEVPKYGNDCDKTDKWAVWFVDFNAEMFDEYRLQDGGRFYTAIASNTQNIGAGYGCGASPDGRLAREPQSDAASPTYGKDTHGPTYTVKSITKPDYTKIACGTVVNQKFSPSMFQGKNNIKRLSALIRVYFERGGQEMQINSVSREVLMDAMEHPENYRDLIVRVSGFSAYYVTLDRSVQLDILSRTEQA